MLLAGFLTRQYSASKVTAQGSLADRKDAKSVIPDSSARALHGAGRFIPLPGSPER